MRLQVNGEPMEVPEGTTVAELLERLRLGTQRVAVERNRDIVPRAEHATMRLQEGDEIEIVHFVGGG